MSSWMLLLATHVHFNPQLSVVHATPMLLFLSIYMLPEVNTSQALEDTVLYTGEERRASRTPSPNGEALFMSLHVLSQCWQRRASCVPWWVLLKSWFGSWGGENPRRGLLSGRMETHPFSGPAASGWAKRTALENMKRPLHFFSNHPLIRVVPLKIDF